MDAGEDNLADPFVDQALHLGQDRFWRNATARSTGIGDKTIGAKAVTSILDLDDRPGAGGMGAIKEERRRFEVALAVIAERARGSPLLRGARKI